MIFAIKFILVLNLFYIVWCGIRLYFFPESFPDFYDEN